ncbi:MAG: S8 family serine peptidase [bacterium]|nr:S8 family serine peptidase [bacterium]
MKRLTLLVILALALPVFATAELSPILEHQMARAGDDELLGVWAFFADKGYAGPAELEAALDAFTAAMNPEQYARRALNRPAGSLADERDLPVYSPYDEAVTTLVTRRIGASSIANAVCFDATAAQIDAVARLPFVVRLQPTATSVLTDARPALNAPYGPTSLDYGPSETQITQIQVDLLHDEGYSGAGVTVLMLDTGFRTDHEALAGLDLKDEWDFVNDDDDVDNEPGDDPDAWNHGTSTWSTLGGYFPTQLIGPAYGATFLLAKTEDITREVHDEEYWYQSGLQWGEALGADVSSSSLGYRYFDEGQGDYSYEELDGETTVVALAVNWARDNGMLHANAMGNDGSDEGTLISPADCDGILSCGAVDADGVLADFSSRGPTADGRTKPEVCALGHYTYAADADSTDTYDFVSGTSLSTPLVGGVLALLREVNPYATAAKIRQAVMDTATQADDPDNDYGWGIVQAYDAAMGLHMDVFAWDSAGAERSEDGALLSWRITTDDGLVAVNIYRLVEPVSGASYASAHLMRTETAFAGETLGPGYRPDAGWTRLNDTPLPGSETGAYLDTGAPGAACYYRFEVFDAQWLRHLSPQVRLSSEDETPLGRETTLGACYPDPARGRVNFSFELGENGRVELTVYDLAGRRVAVLVDAELAAGRLDCVWVVLIKIFF